MLFTTPWMTPNTKSQTAEASARMGLAGKARAVGSAKGSGCVDKDLRTAKAANSETGDKDLKHQLRRKLAILRR